MGYDNFIRLFLKFIENEIFVMSWNGDFYQELRPAWEFLNGKINNEQLFEFEKSAFDNLNNYDDLLEYNIAMLVRHCLRDCILTSPYIEYQYKDKFLGIKRDNIFIIDSLAIIFDCLKDIDEQLSDKFFEWIKSSNLNDA